MAKAPRLSHRAANRAQTTITTPIAIFSPAAGNRRYLRVDEWHLQFAPLREFF